MNNTRLVFISHSSKDAGLAVEICRYLESRGVKCWMALRDIKPGSNYAEAIIEAIRSSQVLLVILSKAVNESKHVANEVERAFHEKLVILPFRIEAFRFSASLEFFLSTAQALDATAGKPEGHLERLYRECFVLTDPERAAELPPMAAAEDKKRKWLAALLLPVGLALALGIYFAGGQKAAGPGVSATTTTSTAVDSGPRPSNHAAAMDTSLSPRRINAIPASVPSSPAAIKALDGAVFIDGPTPADIKSENQISFSGVEGNEIGFRWQQEIYVVQGKMKLKGNMLEVVSGEASGSLSLGGEGTKIRGNLEVKSSGASYGIDFTKAP